jgi:protein tyrosine/serine phosphatase
MQRAAAVLALVLLLASSLSAAKKTLSECTVPSAEDLVPAFHRVDADLYRGGRPAYHDDVYLKFAELGIRTVVNLEGGDQARREQEVIERVNTKLAEQGKPALTFVSFPIDSFTGTVLSAPTNQNIGILFQKIAEAPKPIYVHCKHGKDRTGMVVALYRLWRSESTFDDALSEADYYHFSYWNFGLKRTLDRYRAAPALQALGAPPPTAVGGVCKPSLPKVAEKAAK